MLYFEEKALKRRLSGVSEVCDLQHRSSRATTGIASRWRSAATRLRTAGSLPNTFLALIFHLFSDGSDEKSCEKVDIPSIEIYYSGKKLKGYQMIKLS